MYDELHLQLLPGRLCDDDMNNLPILDSEAHSQAFQAYYDKYWHYQILTYSSTRYPSTRETRDNFWSDDEMWPWDTSITLKLAKL